MECIAELQADEQHILKTLNPIHVWLHKAENNTDEKC